MMSRKLFTIFALAVSSFQPGHTQAQETKSTLYAHCLGQAWQGGGHDAIFRTPVLKTTLSSDRLQEEITKVARKTFNAMPMDREDVFLCRTFVDAAKAQEDWLASDRRLAEMTRRFRTRILDLPSISHPEINFAGPSDFASKKDKPEKPSNSAGKIKWIDVRYPTTGHENGNVRPGYSSATIKLKYGFIACSGEIHVAYAIDPASLETSKDYWTTRDYIASTAAPAPKLTSIGLRAKVIERGAAGPIWRQIDTINDKYAGEALGFGCFTGQTQKVGLVKQLVGPNAKKEEVDKYLERLELADAAVHPWEPLRNMALESVAREAESAEAKRLKAEADERWARLKAQAEAQKAAAKAAQDEYERKMAETKAAQEKFARDQAAHQAELARVRAAEAEYQRKLEEHRRLLASGKFSTPN